MGRIKCPHCGSTNTAKYLWGMPLMDDDLQREIDEGKVVLGGCCVRVAEIDGRTYFVKPSRQCSDCGKDFGTPPILDATEERPAEFYTEAAREVRFGIEEWRNPFPSKEVVIRKDEEGALVETPFSAEPERITSAQWDKLMKRLYCNMYLHEWEEHYEPVDVFVLDGERWELEISFADGRKCTYTGSNAYPPYWGSLKRLMKPYLKGPEDIFKE